jgi:class 3 adenylate cyclase
VDLPTTRYATSGDVQIAYMVLGDGPVNLVYVQGAITNLAVMWELPAFRQFCTQLSGFARLIWFDKRGMGLSDRVRVGTLEERMDDVRAVMDAIDVESAVLLGSSEGGPMSVLFAAAHPERTAGLVLVGAEVKERITEDWPWGEATREEHEKDMATVEARWGAGRFMESVAPSLADPFTREWAGRLQVNSATPSAAEAFMRMAFEIDVRAVAAAVRAPTLVLHRVGDRVCSIENGRFLAREIPGAVFVELPGDDHAPWANGDDIVAEIREFLTGVREASEPDRILVTVLFTDIVRSTEQVAAVGDRAWRATLDAHDQVVREQLRRFRGREVNTTGDGFFAVFDGPARAIRCAQAIRDATAAMDTPIRLGLHTGECEQRGDDLAGLAVHIAARVGALADGSEILVSRTVTDLVAGSGIRFEPRGEHQLRGVPGTWSVYAVV